MRCNKNPLYLMLLSTLFVLPASQVFAGTNPYLPPQLAFSATATTKQIQINVADGYYLYLKKIRLSLDGQPVKYKVVSPVLNKNFGSFGKHPVGVGSVLLSGQFNKTRTYTISYQGCAASGMCYPPITRTLAIGN